MKKMLAFAIAAMMAISAVSVAGVEKPKPITGTVTSVNKEEKSFELSFKDQALRVSTSERTKFLLDMEPADFGIVKTEAKLSIVGKINKEKKTIDAIIVASGKIEMPGEGKKPDFTSFGTIKEIGENSFTFANEKGRVKVNVGEKTKLASKEGSKSFADLEANLEVTVVGILDKETKEVNAFLVFWGKLPEKKEDPKPEPVVGKATNIDVQANTFTLTTKKGELGVVITEKTKFVPEGKTLADINDGDMVSVVGKVDKDAGTIEVRAIMIGKPDKKEGLAPITGKVSSIDLKARTFTLTTEAGKSVSCVWSERTKFFLGKEPKSADDLEDGATIAVIGKVDGKTLNVILVSLDGKIPKKS